MGKALIAVVLMVCLAATGFLVWGGFYKYVMHGGLDFDAQIEINI